MNHSTHLRHAFTFLAFAMVLAAPEFAAAVANPIEDVLCTVVGWLTGPVGAGIATLAVIIIGIGALLGKVSWGMAIIVGIGVAIVFGAGDVVNSLTTNGSNC